MNIATPRKLITLTGFLLAVALWTAPSFAASEVFDVELTGAQQVPPVDTSGSGVAKIRYNPATREVSWDITFKGLSSPATMAHFHGPASEGKNAKPTVWLTKKGSPVESPIKGHATLTPDQAKEFLAGEWYVNVHTKDHQGGEIRGQVVPPKA
jgi:hypothetical protein